MAFADPQTITVATVAQTLNLIEIDKAKSVYATADGVYKFTISHQLSGKRTRHLVRVDRTVVAADPLTAVNASKQMAFYCVVDEPDFGFTDTQMWDVVAALCVWLSNANVIKVLSSQH
jgi:hypothetical protein